MDTNVVLAIGVAVFAVYAGFQVTYILNIRRMADRMEAFLRNTEGDVIRTLAELKGTLESTRRVLDNVNTVTADVREIAETVVHVERGVKDLYRALRGEVVQTAAANVAGLKAGIRAGVVTLVKDMRQERSDDHERGDSEK